MLVNQPAWRSFYELEIHRVNSPARRVPMIAATVVTFLALGLLSCTVLADVFFDEHWDAQSEPLNATPRPALAVSLPPEIWPATMTPAPGAMGIDYANPQKYLAAGEQSRLGNPEVITSLRGQERSIARLGEIYFWIRREFTTWGAGGATIGAVTVDQLVRERRLGGCHDWGLVFASIARELGYPVVMVDAASIDWIAQAQAGQKGGFIGHVFLEVFVGGRWVLVDSTNNGYIETGYDPANPVIYFTRNAKAEGFYVMRKGFDTWGYGIRSNGELTRLMEETAAKVTRADLILPTGQPYRMDRWDWP